MYCNNPSPSSRRSQGYYPPAKVIQQTSCFFKVVRRTGGGVGRLRLINKVIASTILFIIFLSLNSYCLGFFLFKKSRKKRLKKKKHQIEKTINENNQKQISQKQPEIIVKDFFLRETTKNKSDSWTLYSKLGKIFKSLNQIECIDVFCLFKNKDQEIANLKAQKSLLDRNKKTLFISGMVTGNLKELNIMGESINYNFSDQIIKTEKMLTYSAQNFKLTAQKSTFNIKENKIEMTNGIKSEILYNSTSNHSNN